MNATLVLVGCRYQNPVLWQGVSTWSMQSTHSVGMLRYQNPVLWQGVSTCSMESRHSVGRPRYKTHHALAGGSAPAVCQVEEIKQTHQLKLPIC